MDNALSVSAKAANELSGGGMTEAGHRAAVEECVRGAPVSCVARIGGVSPIAREA